MDGPFNLHNASILVVDDLEEQTRVIAAMLEAAGYTAVETTSDPREVAELHRRNRYDLIVLDLMMPGIDGFQVMEALKEVETGGYLPVLAVTAEPEHMKRALASGARDFVAKPVRLVEFTARVQNLLETRLLLKAKRKDAEELEELLRDRTEKLSESEELFRRFAKYIPLGLSIRGVDDRIFTFVNASMEKMLGVPLRAGDNLERALDAYHPVDRLRIVEQIRRMPLGGLDEEVRLAPPGGEPRWAHLRTFPIADSKGDMRWIGVVMEDITDRKRHEDDAWRYAKRLETEIAERNLAEHALRESESRFRALVEQSIAGIFVVEDGRFAYANPRMCEMLGYSIEELRRFEKIDLMLEEDRERLRQNRLRRDAGDAGGLRATYRFRRKDDQVSHLALDGRMLELDGRSVVLGIAQDVTERVRAQELLLEAERHYRALVEQSIVGIYIIDDDRLIYANPRLCEMTGFSHGELSAMQVRDVVVEEDHGVVADALRRRKNGETGAIALSCRVRRKDGGIVHLGIESKIIELGGRRTAIGVVQDMTESARAAAALRESEEKFRLLWETAPDAVILMGDDMRIRYANPSARQVFGYAPEELEGQDIALLQPERLREPHRRAMRRYLKTGQRTINWRSSEIVALHRDGHEFPAEIAFSRLATDAEPVFAGFLRDISERKGAQEALEGAIRRLRVLSKRVLDIQEAERRAISLELHDDVGQSLIALRIGLHRLAPHVAEGEAGLFSECLQVVESVQERLRELSARLHPPQLEQLGLHDALRGLVSRQRAMTGLEIAFDCRGLERERFPLSVEGACYRICQEALNNATQHAHAGHIDVSAAFDGDILELVIRDDGVGFDADGGRDDMLASGGLGLMSMEERARLAGGRLDVRTRPGAGTSIAARFPARVWIAAKTVEKALQP